MNDEPRRVNPIRPLGVAPTPQPAPAQRTDAGRMAGQRAFFDMIAGKAPAAAAAATAAPATPAAVTPATRSAAAPAEAPAKILRPGSLLDIRI
ncbi:hypothetical protein [Phenylobacterium sp. J367]|uniref:hypothetical protein n=1 Tax=Phenylobacterium sp. J367 TaxID=2898435 RepID=UPI002151E754|nr:hypothetical protein [Phenylobacterium sp. J367]MCR5878223.1 hypothetical protein [Phenylobacterium sp. J367]